MSKEPLQTGDRITILVDGRLTLTKVGYVHRGTPTFKTDGGARSSNQLFFELEDEGVRWARGWDLPENDREALLAAAALLAEPPF